MSPYLFVLCMERLAHGISKPILGKRWKLIVLGRDSPSISHLFFVDDLLLFTAADESQAQVVHNVLDYFCEFSGAKVSDSKSSVMFSWNTQVNQREIARAVGFSLTTSLGTYLGMPLLDQRARRESYSYLIDKIRAKLDGFTRNPYHWQDR